MKGENTMNSKIKDFLRKYTMVIALVIVFILFCALTDGRLLFAQNMSNPVSYTHLTLPTIA